MLIMDGECVREPLKRFLNDLKEATNWQFWIRLLASLDAPSNVDVKSPLRGPNLLELSEKRNRLHDCQDKEDFIVSLYNSLAEYCYCRCILACDFMAANIHLNPNDESSPRIENAFKFKLLFQDRHDVQDSQSPCYWRDVEISVRATATTPYGPIPFLAAVKLSLFR
jgi:hypothetical protein